ncbi:MAG: hypothetical protein LBI02_02950 [Opitutaceae bacterium]|jgi:hypothetical protein|nr:hypothetical protein [Opitutaceae bacterium]
MSFASVASFAVLAAFPVAAFTVAAFAAAAIPYARLRTAHTADFQTLFRRVSLRLDAAFAPEIASASAPASASSSTPPTDRRVENIRRAAASTGDPALAALHFHYGRCLLISSSRPGGLPANLQGLWNDRLAPPWFGGWHFDANAQMNYWPASVTALHECHEPLFDLIDRLRENGRKTTREVYGCRGFVVSHRTNAWLFTSPVKRLTVWTAGAGWLCRHYWTHYAFMRDETFLRDRAWPALRAAAAPSTPAGTPADSPPPASPRPSPPRAPCARPTRSSSSKTRPSSPKAPPPPTAPRNSPASTPPPARHIVCKPMRNDKTGGRADMLYLMINVIIHNSPCATGSGGQNSFFSSANPVAS